MKELIIFGTNEIAEVAYYYFKNDSCYRIAAFTLDSEYIKDNVFESLPIIAFDEIQKKFPPDKYNLFIAMSYSKLNSLRQKKYLEAKAKGYELVSYVSSKATVWPDLHVGDNCFILEDNTIQPYVKIGNNVTLWSGNHIGHHTQIADNCFLASHIVVSGGVKIDQNCFIGVNATLYDHINIAKNCIIGAGAIISRNTVENEIYKAESTKPTELKTG